MTAEIAVLNKYAVALATDSAVTVSAGLRDEKVFDSADKLFELSRYNPIGIMIYQGMSFMEAPMPSLIKQFRRSCCRVNLVDDALREFLDFLNDFGRKAYPEIAERHVDRIAGSIINQIISYVSDKLDKEVFRSDTIPDNLAEIADSYLFEAIDLHAEVFANSKTAEFVGKGALVIDTSLKKRLKKLVDQNMPMLSDDSRKSRVETILQNALERSVLSDEKTGIVIAGFGDNEIFPTLISVEIDGMVCGRLKFVRTNAVDIDSRGPKARVLPFAQKEMVERFLYGLDDQSQYQIDRFCRETLPSLSESLIDNLVLSNEEDREALRDGAKRAETAFLEGLKDGAFEKIRSQSQAEIEDMVEFMPKPELAQMAEALIELTSVKRRVSRGMETVGGPIDVAVISQAEGFVWVKRKHYFPQELNARYFERVRLQSAEMEHSDGEDAELRSISSARGRKAEPRTARGKHVASPSGRSRNDQG